MNINEKSYHNGKYTYRLALQRARYNNAFPQWADTPSIKKQILAIYVSAQLKNIMGRGKKYHVDHIIPLKGANICGLHIPSNLRIITKKSNEAKSNSFTPFREKNGRRTKLAPLREEPQFVYGHKRKGKKNPTKKSSKRMAKKIIFKKRNFYG